jgi:hypothetical protein
MGEHGLRGLNGNHVVSMRSEPGSVTAGACTDVEHGCAGWRKHVKEPSVNVLKGQRLILLDQSSRVLFVVRDRCHRLLFITVELQSIVVENAARLVEGADV